MSDTTAIPVSSLVANIEKELDTLIHVPEGHAPLPEQVREFTESVGRTFEKTAVNLEVTAAKLEQAAADLRNKADQLRSAAPAVKSTVEEWIRFERSAHDRHKFFGSLFEERLKPAHVERKRMPWNK